MSNCCRLCQEVVFAVVVNRSGQDSGCVDYSIPIRKWDKHTLLKALDEMAHIRTQVLGDIDFYARKDD